MIFNGIEKDYITVLRGRIRPFFAPLSRDKKFDNNLVKTDRGHRVIEVPVFIKYDNLEHFRALTEDIAGWLVHDKPKVLSFKDEPDRIYYSLVDDTMNEDFLYNIGTESVIKFICGYKYSQERIIEATGTHDIKGHTSTTWKTKTVFTSNQTGYELQFNASGKSNLRDINRIVVNGEFLSGDTLEIDYSKRKIILNGNDISNQLVIMQSNYRELDIGNVEFTASHETEIYYHERYY